MFWRFRVNFLFFLFCEYIYRYWALENLSLSLQNSSRSGFLSFLSQLLGKNNRNKITTLRKVRFFLVSFKLRHLHIEKDSVTCLIWSTFRWQLKYTTHRYENQTLVITSVSSSSTVLSLRALRVSCFSLLFVCALPSVTSRELYTMRSPVDLPLLALRSPRIHRRSPEAIASMVHHTISVYFCVCSSMRLC